MKKFFSASIFLLLLNSLFSQTLFTYGKYSVSSKEFLRAFEKNNAIAPAADRSKAMQEYLQLYIKSKLKVREAYDRGYDTLPAIVSEVNSLRLQIIDNYMNDPEAIEKLTKEAFDRSQKDIHAAHLFISFTTNTGAEDIKNADAKKEAALKRLNAGDDFFKVAADLSDDPSAKTNGGDLGYITVFTLPYVFENIVYTTAPGKFSVPYRSRSGYHIFKNIEERKAIGKLKMQQLLLALPPGSTESEKLQLKNRADSIYRLMLAGEDFSRLAAIFSNDYLTAPTGGDMQPFGVGQYDPIFEKTAFALKKDGDVSAPFETVHGFHIIKRSSSVPVVADRNDKNNWTFLRNNVNNPERTAASQQAMVQRVQKQIGFKTFPYQKDVLYNYTDSMVNNSRLAAGKRQDANAPLYKIGDSTLGVPDWIGYAQVFRYTNSGGPKPYDVLMEEFMQANVMQYYRNNLEKYNEDFRSQMNEFKDGNLFFEIMQREIWNTAQTDSAGLRNYYEKNKSKYFWKPSADAVLFFCNDEKTADELYSKLKSAPSDWRNIVYSFEEKVSADSNRMELENIQLKNKATPAPGFLSEPLVNKSDNTATVAYILKLYPGSLPRSFDEAKGLVLNDYQTVLDDKWVAELKKKYPVVINQPVFKSLK